MTHALLHTHKQRAQTHLCLKAYTLLGTHTHNCYKQTHTGYVYDPTTDWLITVEGGKEVGSCRGRNCRICLCHFAKNELLFGLSGNVGSGLLAVCLLLTHSNPLIVSHLWQEWVIGWWVDGWVVLSVVCLGVALKLTGFNYKRGLSIIASYDSIATFFADTICMYSEG